MELPVSEGIAYWLGRKRPTPRTKGRGRGKKRRNNMETYEMLYFTPMLGKKRHHSRRRADLQRVVNAA